MNYPKLLAIYAFFILFFSKATILASDVVDFGALNSKIIFLHFDDGYVRYHQKGESRSNEWVISEPLDIYKAADVQNFQIKSSAGYYAEVKNPVKIERKSKGTEFTWLCQNWSQAVGCVNSDADHAKEHWLYLYLPEPLEQGQKYIITTNDLAGNENSWEVEFSPEKNRSEAIHVNLVGYDPRAPKKYGYVYHWGGSAGSIDFSKYSENNFYLIDTESEEKMYTGQLLFRKNKTNIETRQANDTPNQNFLGADVWECNFSDFNTPGEYYLAVEGVGRSFAFKIKKDIYRLPFYTSIRGLYHNRSGIALEEPYTEFTRPVPHNPLKNQGFAGKLLYTTSRFIDWKDMNYSADDLPAIEDGILGPLNTWGWYQDAGDWDGYFWHMKIPAILMLTWEIAPEKFADGELNIPEGKNGIPDILDEANWLIRFFYRTRHAIMDKGFGTGGVGSRVAPDWYGHAEEGTPSYEDTGKWIISGEDPFTTYFYAGLAGHYAAILNKLNVEDPNGIDWIKEAEEAFNWAKNNTKTKDTNPDNVHGYNIYNFQLYAAVSLFRLTGEAEYAQIIEQNTTSTEGNEILDEDEKWGIYSLIVADEFNLGNPPLMDKLKNAVLTTADQKNSSVEQRACRYGGNIWLPMLVGQGTTPRVFEMMLGHYVSKEKAPAKTEEYLANIFTTADYFLGCNPLNMAWITHVGVRYPERVMHLDSWYNGMDEMAPGITPYGPWKDGATSAAIGPWDLHWPYKTLYPEGIEHWPGHERWYNNYTTPANAEFTIHQNTILSAAVYGYLCDEADGAYQPNERPSVQLIMENDSVVLDKSIQLSATASDPNGANDIAWVEFYNDWHKVGQSNKPPYTVEWKTPKYGIASLSAKVVDKSGYSSKSEEITVEIVPTNHKVTIEVKDSLTGEIIPGSQVEINQQVLTTGPNGIAEFDSVNGLFDLKLVHDNYKTLIREQVEVYSDTTLTFPLTPEVYDVTIVVQDKNTGEFFPGVPVTFNAEEQVTNENGEVFYEIFIGDYNYAVTKNSFADEWGTLNVLSDTIIYVQLIRTKADIKIVLKEGTTPVNNATVVLNGDTVISTGLGIARFRNLPVDSTYTYQILKEGYDEMKNMVYLTTDTSINVSMVVTSVGIPNTPELLKLWPNPITEKLNIASSIDLENVEVFSIGGNKVRDFKGERNKTLSFDLSGLKAGTYLIRCNFTTGVSEVRSIEKH